VDQLLIGNSMEVNLCSPTASVDGCR